VTTTVPAAAEQRPFRDRAPIPPAVEQRIEQALAAYAAGDDRAPARLVAGRPNLAQVERVLTRDGRPWAPALPAFVLELVAELPKADAFRAPSLLKVGWALMVIRPTPLGADPDEDRFEILWHQAALGLAQGLQQYWLQQDHLDLLALRYTDTPQELGRTRIPLARAMAAAGLCCWTPVPGETIQLVQPSARRPVSPDQAVALFEAAAATPSLRNEALIRGAVLLRTLGRDAEALAWLDRVPPHDDRALGYVQHFTRARLLDGTARTADAVDAYRAALDHQSGSQPAAIGLAAALLRSGRPSEAAGTAVRARTMPVDTAPPDRAFRQGDLRFFQQWMAELRSSRRPKARW
jgi:hypothetical protein